MNTARAASNGHSGRIDAHNHIIPPFWAQTLATKGGDPSGWRVPEWTPEGAIAFMDEQRIATAMLSFSAPSVTAWDGQERRDLARRVNDFTADMVTQNPLRFGNFATLPLPDVDGALEELRYALDILGADGVIVLTNYRGAYLGDPAFEPLWAELDRRESVVFVHPAKPPLPLIDGIAAPLTDYPFDTTRAAVHLVLAGVMSRYTKMKLILSHAGGFLPYAADRFAELAPTVRSDIPDKKVLLEQFRRFYFDTALSASSAALLALQNFAPRGHILYGSDFPYAPASVGASFTAKLDAFEHFSQDERTEVNTGNARRLFAGLPALVAAND